MIWKIFNPINMRKLTVYCLILVELIVITYLSYRLYDRYIKYNPAVKGTYFVNPIYRNTIDFPQNDQLKYYYEPKPNKKILQYPEWSNKTIIHTINSDTINSLSDYEVIKPEKTFRIVVLGDSFTYGLGVNTQDAYPAKLEEYLNQNLSCNNISKFEVLNLGVDGYDAIYSNFRYQYRGAKYKSDLVIWYLVDNDFTDFNELIYVDHTNGFAKDSTWEYVSARIIAKFGIVKITHDEFQAIKNFTNSFEGPIIFTSYTGFYYWDLLNILKINRNNIFLNGFDPESLPDGHPSVLGHFHIAQHLFDFIIQNKIIPCN